MSLELKKFSQIVTIKKGEPITKAEANEGPYPVILGGKEPAYYIDRFNHEGKAIVVSRSGASAGYVSLWNEPIFITDGFLVEPINGNHLEYVYYLLKHYGKILHDLQNGAAIPHVTPKTIYGMRAYVPSFSTQQRIATILSTYDNLIEVNNKRIRVLEQMAENLYKEWFVRFRFPGHETAEFENGIPKGWHNKKLFDIAKITYGYAFSSDEFCEDASLNAVVRIRDVPYNATNTYTSEPCDDKYLISENAILVGMDGIFHMCLWNGKKAYLNQRVVEIESTHNSLCNYMLYLFIAPQIKFWEQVITGTTVAHLGDKHLKRVSVLMPDDTTLRKTNSVFESIMIEKNLLFKENEKLIKQRDLLLPRLMNGKLEV